MFLNNVARMLLAPLLKPKTALAQQAACSPSAAVSEVYSRLTADERVRRGLEFIYADHDNTLSEQKELCAIAAPPFKERARALNFCARLQALGLTDVRIDREGNVLGLRRGLAAGPKLVASAHLDTVFPAGTDTTVKEAGGRLYAPGIADDARGLAVLLSVIRALDAAQIETMGDIIFCATVGEEGAGDLRGVKRLFSDHADIDGFISLDGSGAGLTYLATGSIRYQVIFTGPGGHSFGAFGLPSAIHALGRAIAKLADIITPDDPKTTFTVGTVTGGTSVNAIAANASMEVDLRSNSAVELNKLKTLCERLVRQAADEENARWGSKQISVTIKQIGCRPAGCQSADLPIIQAALAATQAVGRTPLLNNAASTDANLPIYLGIPAIAMGGGGTAGGCHSPNEWFDPTHAYWGPQRAFLTILGLVGLKHITSPLLPIRKQPCAPIG